MNDCQAPTPNRIMDIGYAFCDAKLLLTAVQFQLFTIIAKHGKMSAKQIKNILSLECSDRHLFDYLDSLVCLNFLQRQGLLQNAFYSNVEDVDAFLDKNKESYIGGVFQMANKRQYGFWGLLDTALRTGKPQNQLKDGVDLFALLYSCQQKLKVFVQGMAGAQILNFNTLAQKFQFQNYKTLVDIGGCDATLSVCIAKQHPNIECINFDLQKMQKLAKENIEKHGLQQRIKVLEGNFFKEPFPKADIIFMGNILHDWPQDQKDYLIKQAHNALNEGGVFIIIQTMIDNERKDSIPALTTSLHMLLQTNGGFNFTFDDFQSWVTTAGFKTTKSIMLNQDGEYAIVAYK